MQKSTSRCCDKKGSRSSHSDDEDQSDIVGPIPPAEPPKFQTPDATQTTSVPEAQTPQTPLSPIPILAPVSSITPVPTSELTTNPPDDLSSQDKIDDTCYVYDGYGKVPRDVVNVKIKDGVTTLDSGVFWHCKALKTLVIPNSVTTLGDYTFLDCSALESVTLPEPCTWTGKEIYLGCTSLKSLTIRYIREVSDITIEDGPGPQLGFRGEPQKGYGPERCAVSLQQIQELKGHRHYHNDKYLMRDFVRDVIEPSTDGIGMSYALFRNRLSPLTAKVMVSHAWDESIRQFVEAIERSKKKGPFWVCAYSIYQNNDPTKGVTISQQLGVVPEYGPFATVLSLVPIMIAVLTDECDIYTRLWCVYEIYIAVRNGVNVRLAPHISEKDLCFGYTEKDICVHQAYNQVDSEEARCGRPGTAINDDEIAIRNVINDSANGFKAVDEAVERIRLTHLVTYPTNQIERNKSTARDSIKDAIEHILPRFAQELKTFDEFLSDELLAHPGFNRTPRKEDYWLVLDNFSGDGEMVGVDHDYCIEKGYEKHDVFNRWTSYILDTLSK